MEKKIFEELITRLSSAEALAYISAATTPADQLDPPQTITWWEEQVEAALSKDPKDYPFMLPAVFIHFSKETEYGKSFTNKKADGEITLHLVQDKIGKDGRNDAETIDDFKLLLDYADLLVDLLDGYQLPCSAKPILAKIKRDHTNSPLLHEEIVFTWHGTRRREPIPDLP